MHNLFTKEVLLHPLITGAVALSVVLAGGSVWYYVHGSTAPAAAPSATSGATADAATVVVGGIVAPAENPDLAFLAGGRVAQVNVAVGAQVTKGQTLASLDTSALVAARAQAAASLKAAQANLALQGAQKQNTTVNLGDVQSQQDALVENARVTLYSDGLTAVPASDDYGVSAPTISGRYSGPEGTYKIVISHGEQLGLDTHVVRTFGVDESGTTDIEKGAPTKLGNDGLYISFPQQLSAYDDTTWYVTIPNTTSSDYAENYNAYQAALAARASAVSNAEAALRGGTGTTVSEAQRQSAEAQVDAAAANLQAADAALRNAIITAPFDGVVTAVQVKVGDTISANAPALSLNPSGALEVDAYLSEVDAARVASGDAADVTLDSYGSARGFSAAVLSVDRSPTMQGGVPAYKVTLLFTNDDPSIAVGMTANATIYPSHTI
jgi:multidrug resistance efflux pump